MNPTELSDRLHVADDLEVKPVDAIIAGAIQQGQRRRRTRQRVVPALVGVVALAMVVGLAGVLAVRDGRSSTPAATPTPTVGSGTPTHPRVTGADVLALVEAHLPKGMSVERRSATSYAGSVGVLMILEDANGPAQAEAQIYPDRKPEDGRPPSGCTREGHCRRIRADGKTFYEYTDWKGSGKSRHYDVATYYVRPDGKFTAFTQHNYVDRGGPVTRPPLGARPEWPVTGPTLPLTEAEVQALLTAPEWDALAGRCQDTTFC